MSRIYIIGPTKDHDCEAHEQILVYIKWLEIEGHDVYFTFRDADNFECEICDSNIHAMMYSDEVHIWFDPSNYFDLGMACMLRRFRNSSNYPLKFVLINNIDNYDVFIGDYIKQFANEDMVNVYDCAV